MTPSMLEEKVVPLLNVLDEDIRYVEGTLQQLDTLRAFLIKRDDKALQKLLEEVRSHGSVHAANEQRRCDLRQDLTTTLEWTDGQITLSGILGQVTGQTRAELVERQKKLKTLVARLKREYTKTALLLSHCTRFNRSLLQIFLGPPKGCGTTYRPTGAAAPSVKMSMLNMQF